MRVKRNAREEKLVNAVFFPDDLRTIRHGSAVTTSQKIIACPKGSPNQSRHRYAGPRQCGGPLHRSASKRFFSSTGRGAFSFWRCQRGLPPRPARWERRSKGAGAVFAADGNEAWRTLRRRNGGRTQPPGGSQTPWHHRHRAKKGGPIRVLPHFASVTSPAWRCTWPGTFHC